MVRLCSCPAEYIERLWPELSCQEGVSWKIDMTVKFCVSWTTINVIKSAIGKFVAAWNAHRIRSNSGTWTDEHVFGGRSNLKSDHPKTESATSTLQTALCPVNVNLQHTKWLRQVKEVGHKVPGETHIRHK